MFWDMFWALRVGGDVFETYACFQVDGSEKELFGTDAKVYGHRLRCSSDVRSKVCFSLCDDANVIVGSKTAIMYGLCFAATS